MDQTTDAGLCDSLVGTTLPNVFLPSTRGGTVALEMLTASRTVIYCYPRTSEPGKPAPAGWDVIPGARGCTPQACAFRDHHKELTELGAEVWDCPGPVDGLWAWGLCLGQDGLHVGFVGHG